MAINLINLGTAPTGAGGDDRRGAWVKGNAMFQELYTGKAGSGANTDITSITGLTTALAVGQGGTGANSVAGARTSLGIKSAGLADIIGAVSQTGGTPTGAIMRRTVNSNGVSVRFANGLQLFYVKTAVTWGANVATRFTANFTEAFQGTPVIFSQLRTSDPGAYFCSPENVSNIDMAFYVKGQFAGGSDVYLFAIGAWF